MPEPARFPVKGMAFQATLLCGVIAYGDARRCRTKNRDLGSVSIASAWLQWLSIRRLISFSSPGLFNETLHPLSSVARFVPRRSQESPCFELSDPHPINDVPVALSLVDMTIAESRWGDRYGFVMLLIHKKSLHSEEIGIIPESRLMFLDSDHLIVFGSREKLDTFKRHRGSAAR